MNAAMIVIDDSSESKKQSLPMCVPSVKNEAINITPHMILDAIAKTVDKIPKKINECERIAEISENADTHISSAVKIIKIVLEINFIL